MGAGGRNPEYHITFETLLRTKVPVPSKVIIIISRLRERTEAESLTCLPTGWAGACMG